ncbi:hypothetical protein JD844_002278 [Phrynosoma platyrhinos]|uniref:Granulins domain-containing protein n=1 Tax=Phrynosoma platyrhinos TaxID=52577 RepID=A0ABQ7TB52_PHRPL|nr:hypothetical protein JD844_002278 [Phrynosoma platyrhinos]
MPRQPAQMAKPVAAYYQVPGAAVQYHRAEKGEGLSNLAGLDAVCCPDHIHCCPNGYSCDQSTGSCVKRGDNVPWLEKKAAILAIGSESRDVRCDDETSYRVHCCPNGYTCDPSSGTCLESQHSLPWAPKLPAQMLQSQGIRCNDTASCEDGQTCCKSVSGAWSCCQLPNAVCCEDHQHCCPSGYTCNVAAQTCEKQQMPKTLASGSLLMSSQVSTSSLDVSCGDQHYCQDGQTCCEAKSGGEPVAMIDATAVHQASIAPFQDLSATRSGPPVGTLVPSLLVLPKHVCSFEVPFGMDLPHAWGLE